MEIREVDRDNKDFQEFSKSEWAKVDLQHYGQPIEWIEHTVWLAVYDNEAIVGVAKIKHMAGVTKVIDLLVAHDKRRKGIGSLLIQDIEKRAAAADCHKVHLVTGASWDERKFYEKLEYEYVGLLEKHFMGVDWVAYSKWLD